MDIQTIDPTDDAAVAEAHTVYSAAESYGRPHSDAMTLAAFRANLRAAGADPWRAWTLRVAEAPVAVAMLTWRDLDNPHACWGWVSVLPEHRRNGYGSALLGTLADAARGLGREVLELDAIEPIGAESPPSHGFLAAHGLRPVMHEVRSRLRLPVPGGLLDELAASVPTGLAYVLETWQDVAPEHRREAFRSVLGLVEIESPYGERQVEPEVWTEDRLRDTERRRQDAGQHGWTSAAFTPDGACAGFTELFTTGDGLVARQGGTLVAPGHRGHRLGLALKLANLRALTATRPDLTAVTTYTSPANAPMLGVNDALGFAPIETLDLWSLDLS